MKYSQVSSLSATKQVADSLGNVANQKQEKENHQRGDASQDRSSALNDVKNRLLAMQRNKEELEEKLKTYEAKIRQHFNRQ